MTTRARDRRRSGVERPPDPTWYKDAIIYEAHVRAFCDSNGDGIGDFAGLVEKLDYVQDLGVTALWVLPFYPSPLRDDGYDIADYVSIHPAYGTLRTFRTFLHEAHRRGLRVITELVLNHTSDRHPWFQRARTAPRGSRWRNFYVWSDTTDRYRDARVIFKDFEAANWTFDPVAGAHYWHRFYSHQPDLNYDSPDVRREMLRVVTFWLDQGVDGLRLDAVPYLYEREGTTCENLPETHAFLRELRGYVDGRYSDRMLLAEANQWPEDAIAYFGAGDECHMAYHFPLMPRLFMAIRMEDRFPIIDILTQTPAIADTCQWALFLRNHDELTLEMVTDEDRDYMYRVYAQDPHARINLGIRRRLAPLLGNHRRRVELMNGLLFSIPGTPLVYYGDEIGMGDNIYLGDRNAVRTPMQWSADRNAGFSRANPQQLYLPVVIDSEYHYETVNVAAQQGNPHSLLWWMKRLIALRKRYNCFGRGTLEMLAPDNRKVLAFLRRHEDQRVLVVANLSRFVQPVELGLSEFRGMVPVELFGRTEFPPVGELPYFLTLGPHAFYWFSLEPQRAAGVAGAAVTGSEAGEASLPELSAVNTRGWAGVFEGPARSLLEDALAAYLRARRWFGGKARRARSALILDTVRIPYGGETAYLTLIQVQYAEGDPDVYALPLTFGTRDRVPQLRRDPAQAAVARLRVGGDDTDGVLFDAFLDTAFCAALLDMIRRRQHLRGAAGELVATPTQALRRVIGPAPVPEPMPVKAEQSNTSVFYGDRCILKLFRRLEPGQNPELEIGRFLTERAAFPNVPAVAGALEYRPPRGETVTVAVLQEFVPNEGDAWAYTLDALDRYCERAMAEHAEGAADDWPSPHSPLALAARPLPEAVYERVGEYLHRADLLGQRTAELHRALASDAADPAFAPEPITASYQRSLYQAARALTQQTLPVLRKALRTLPGDARASAERVLEAENELLRRFQSVLSRKITGTRIRCHGDYHLGQVLYTGKDFVIIDFEGEPARTLTERRIKRPALRDVAGMLRSFHYAAYSALRAQIERGAISQHPAAAPFLDARLAHWRRWACASFLRGYLRAAGDAPFLPRTREEIEVLLNVHLLEKAVYELGYELNNRPGWARIPLEGILELLAAGG
ncbi:MAG TPA: maltose alpha-D-glucosyltransferase [bacterium]|nr:maltose alpha-D-glucosyltransferase [bacterium]